VSLVRRFAGLGQLATFLESRAAVMVPTGRLAMVATADLLFKKVRGLHGDHVLPDLAPATQQDRVDKGFTPNDPLKRDGRLLRDSVEQEVGPDYAAVGSPELVALYHEFGFHNARTGTDVPPRQVYRLGLEEIAAPAMSIMQAILGVQLGFSDIAAVAPAISGVASSASHSALISELP
jgi:phage gpG-like protein